MTLLPLLFFPAMMAYAACSDLITMRISNKLVLALAAGFFGVALLMGMPLTTVGMHMAAGALVLTVTFGLFAAGWGSS
jgi:prepilin peptidase CpaA